MVLLATLEAYTSLALLTLQLRVKPMLLATLEWGVTTRCEAPLYVWVFIRFKVTSHCL